MIYTSYYGRKNLYTLAHQRGVNLVRVSKTAPDSFSDIITAPEVFPTWSMINLVKEHGDYTAYKREYWMKILRFINVQEWYNRYNNSVLLCWEHDIKKCHRYLLGKWLLWGKCDYVGEL